MTVCLGLHICEMGSMEGGMVVSRGDVDGGNGAGGALSLVSGTLTISVVLSQL